MVTGLPLLTPWAHRANILSPAGPAGRAGDYKTHSVRVCVSACVRVFVCY